MKEHTVKLWWQYQRALITLCGRNLAHSALHEQPPDARNHAQARQRRRTRTQQRRNPNRGACAGWHYTCRYPCIWILAVHVLLNCACSWDGLCVVAISLGTRVSSAGTCLESPHAPEWSVVVVSISSCRNQLQCVVCAGCCKETRRQGKQR